MARLHNSKTATSQRHSIHDPSSQFKNLVLAGNIAGNWRKFRQNFELYLAATGLDTKTSKQKITVLLHVARKQAIEVYNTSSFTEEYMQDEREDTQDEREDTQDQREDTQDQREDTQYQRENTQDQREDTRDQPEEKLCFLPTEILKIIIDNVLNIALSYGLSLSLVSRSFVHMVQLYMECVSPARMTLYRAASIHIRDSLQMELGIHGQHHHMLSVRRLMTTAGKFSGLANVVRKLLQQIDNTNLADHQAPSLVVNTE